jgi:hypothetical protein
MSEERRRRPKTTPPPHHSMTRSRPFLPGSVRVRNSCQKKGNPQFADLPSKNGLSNA